MNFKGIILSVVSFLLVAVSCSVENDVYMNDVNKEMAAASEEYASLSFNISMGAQTKSVSGPTTEDASTTEAAIENCIIVLTEGNTVNSKIVASRNVTAAEISIDGDILALDANMMIKAKDNLYAVAIANADYSIFSSCNTLGDLDNRSLTLTQNGYLVKVSKPVAVGSIPEEYKSTSTKENNVYTIPSVITLTQLAAKVELVAFNVSYTGDDAESLEAPVVELQKIALANAKKESNVFSQAGNSFDMSLEKVGTPNIDYTTNETLFSCYTFQNEDQSNKTALELTIQVGNKAAKVKSYTIKTPENGQTLEVVRPGYIYRVTVNLSVNKISKEFDVNLQYEAVPFQQVTVNIPDFE